MNPTLGVVASKTLIPGAGCPAKGKTCSRCDDKDHFATVCLKPLGHEPRSRFNQQYPSNRGKGRGTRSRGRGRGGQFQRQNNYQLLQQQTIPTKHQQTVPCNPRLYTTPAHIHASNNTENPEEYYTDNYDCIPAPQFCLDTSHETHATSVNSGNKYYANVLTSIGGTKFRPVKYQIDTAATCNNISVNTVQLHFPAAHQSKSPYVLFPYGDSMPLKPVGQVDILCERGKKYFTLTFQILPDHVMHNKPALLSGKDSQKMGFVNIHADEIHALEPKPFNHSPEYQLKPTQATSNNSDQRCPLPQPLLKEDVSLPRSLE